MLKYHTIGRNSRYNYVPLFYGKSYKYHKMKVYFVLFVE